LNAAARAVVVHLTPRRIRIKIPGWKRRDADFAALRGRLERCPGVVDVRVNPLVASIVVHCSERFQILSARHCFVGLELVFPAAMTAGARARMWQFGSIGCGRRHSAFSSRLASGQPLSGRLAAVVVDLAIAVWAHRLESVIIEWIIRGVVQALLRRLYRSPTPLQHGETPRQPLLAAAAA
jgi:hypothetical protein